MADVVNRCLAKDPGARYRDLRALRADLERIQSQFPAAPPSTDSDDETKSLLDVAAEYLEAGKLVQAGELLERLGEAAGGASKDLKFLKVERRWRDAVAEAAAVAVEAALGRFDAGDHDAAIDELGTFTPDHVLIHEAATGLEARRQWITGRLAAARAALDEQRPEAALGILEALRQKEPVAPGLPELLTRARREEQARRLDDNQRQAQVAAWVVEAQALLARQDLETAATRVAQALELDAANEQAQALQATIEQGLEALERERQAESVAESARRDFDAGRHADALAQVEAFSPPHTVVRGVLDALRGRRDWIDAQLAAVREARDTGEVDEAVQRLERLESREPATPGLKSLLDETRRQRQLATLVASAAADLRRAALAAALAKVDEALHLDAAHNPALELKAEIEERQRRLSDDQRAETTVDHARLDFDAGLWSQALNALEGFAPPHDAVTQELAVLRARRQWIDERLIAARGVLDAGDHAAAIRCLDELERREPNEPALADLLGRARRLEKLTRLVSEAGDARQHDDLARATTLVIEALQLDPGFEPAATLRGDLLEEVERRASGLAVAARQQFAEGRQESALASLEAFRPRHEIVTTELETLRSRRTWVERQLTAADSTLTADRPAAALALLEEVADREPGTPGLADRLGRARGRDEVLTTLTVARQHLEAGDVAAALTRADRALELDPSSEDARALRDTLERRRRQAERQAQRRRASERGLAVLRRTVSDRRLQIGAAVTVVAVGIWTQVPFGPPETTSAPDTAEIGAQAQASPASNPLGLARDVGSVVPVDAAPEATGDAAPSPGPGDTPELVPGDPPGTTPVETSASAPVGEPRVVDLSSASDADDSTTDSPSANPTVEPVPVDREPTEIPDADPGGPAAEPGAANLADTTPELATVDTTPDPDPAAPLFDPTAAEPDAGVSAPDPDAVTPVGTTPAPDTAAPAPDTVAPAPDTAAPAPDTAALAPDTVAPAPDPVAPPAASPTADAPLSAEEVARRASLLDDQLSELTEHLEDWYAQSEAGGIRDIWPDAPSSWIEPQNAFFEQTRARDVEFNRCGDPIGLGPDRAAVVCTVTLSFTPRVGGGSQTAVQQWQFQFAWVAGRWELSNLDF